MSPGFALAFKEAFESDLFKEFLRLEDIKSFGPRSPIEAMIDEATGFDKTIAAQQREVLEKFREFVSKYVWATLPPETRFALEFEAMQKEGAK